MGHLYAREVLGVGQPRVGLMIIEKRTARGRGSRRGVSRPQGSSAFNFIGNVEGRDIFNGKADVIVCDGFIGNVSLKASRAPRGDLHFMKEEISKSFLAKLGYVLARPALRNFRKKVDTRIRRGPSPGVRARRSSATAGPPSVPSRTPCA